MAKIDLYRGRVGSHRPSATFNRLGGAIFYFLPLQRLGVNKPCLSACPLSLGASPLILGATNSSYFDSFELFWENGHCDYINRWIELKKICCYQHIDLQ